METGACPRPVDNEGLGVRQYTPDLTPPHTTLNGLTSSQGNVGCVTSGAGSVHSAAGGANNTSVPPGMRAAPVASSSGSRRRKSNKPRKLEDADYDFEQPIPPYPMAVSSALWESTCQQSAAVQSSAYSDCLQYASSIASSADNDCMSSHELIVDVEVDVDMDSDVDMSPGAATDAAHILRQQAAAAQLHTAIVNNSMAFSTAPANTTLYTDLAESSFPHTGHVAPAEPYFYSPDEDDRGYGEYEEDDDGDDGDDDDGDVPNRRVSSDPDYILEEERPIAARKRAKKVPTSSPKKSPPPKKKSSAPKKNSASPPKKNSASPPKKKSASPPKKKSAAPSLMEAAEESPKAVSPKKAAATSPKKPAESPSTSQPGPQDTPVRCDPRKIQKAYQCPLCWRSFETPVKLNKHRKIHDSPKPFKCQYCDKSFRQIGNRKMHERIHTGEKPYDCQFCEKKFRFPSELSTHVQGHTGTQTDVCLLCAKMFPNGGALRRHKLKMHKDQSEKIRVKCPKCKLWFSTASLLSEHVCKGEVVEDLSASVCPICSCEFDSFGDLEKHECTEKQEAFKKEE